MTVRLVSALIVLCAASAHAQLTIKLRSIPANTPPNATIYVAGTFNNWNPGAAGYQLSSLGKSEYSVTIPDIAPGVVEFKFTLGSWASVETSGAGADVPNRVFTVSPKGGTYTGSVAAWRDPRNIPEKKSTATKSVSILADSFYMPQLDRKRRIWVYVPPDYATSQKTYPVIYMHDGQNVFDAKTSFAGELGVDETLDSLHATGDWGAIVVAVDNAGFLRSDEYHPFKNVRNPQWGGGHGDAYLDFIVQTLKPHIDTRFRTRTDRLNTGIAGASSGGLIAFYAALKYPAVFGRVLAFSPAFFVNPQVYEIARAAKPQQPPTRFSFISGWEETVPGQRPGLFAGPQREMVETLKRAGFDVANDVRSLLPADGAHAEWFWRREFPAAYRWLFNTMR